MSLSSDLISQFVKATTDTDKSKKETTVYGTIVKQGSSTFVKLDGSELLTPVTSTTVVKNGERVTVLIKNHSAIVTGNVSSPSAQDSEVQKIGGKITELETVVADKVSTKELDAEKGRIDEVISNNVLIRDRLTANETITQSLSADNATIKNRLTATEVITKKHETEKLDAVVADIKFATIGSLEVTDQKVHNLEGDYGKFKTLTTDKFAANESRFKTIETEKISANEADLKYATITELHSEYVKTTTFEALNGKVGVMDIDLGRINTLISGSVTAGSTQTIVLNAENTTIANALIKSAMIDSLSFNKITGVDINTSNIKVHSSDGMSQWTNNTIQIKDKNRVRVQIGRDASDDYNLYVWDALGNLMFDATGVTNKGIQRPIIVDGMIANNANISGDKVNITSVIQKINANSTLIESSHISYDGKSLDVAFNSMQTSVNTVTKTITDNKSKWDTASTNASDALSKATSVETRANSGEFDGRGVKTTAVTYQAAASGTTAPTGTWTTTIPTVNAGQYLWTRTIITYTDNTTTTAYSVAKMAINGANGGKGDKGDTGATGNGISGVATYYLASASASGITTATAGWTTTPQAVSTSKKYHWSYQIISYTNGSKTTTTPAIIGVYGDTGAKGATGASGKGISAVVPQYYLSTSNTAQSGGSWKTTQDAWSTGKYYWTRDAITWSDGSTTYTTPALATGLNNANTNAQNAITQVTTVTETVKSHSTQITAQEGKISALITDTIQVKKDITAVQGDVTTAKGNITTLQTNYSSLQQTVGGLSSKVGEHTSSIATVTTTVNNNKANWDKAPTALSTANTAKTLADSKSKVFNAQPTTPYKVGDLWVQGSGGNIMRCKVARASGSYTASDWEKADKYTDDTKANAVDARITTEVKKVTDKQSSFEQSLTAITGRVSSTESTVSTVKSTVDTNKANWDKAPTALSTANTAKSTADSAKSTATTANNTANSAILATKVTPISGSAKLFKNVAGYSNDTANVKGAFVIVTPILPSKMCRFRITGYNYVSGTNSNIDITVTGYNYDGSIVNCSYTNAGSVLFSSVKLAKVSATDKRLVIILGGVTDTWQYPKISVETALISYSSTPPDSYKDGWSVSLVTTLSTAYVHTVSVPGMNVQSEITSVKTKESNLELTVDQFKTTVSSTYATKTQLSTVDGKFANYATTSAMNSAITQKANEITTAVSNTYTTKTEFGKLTTSSSNMLRNTTLSTNNNYFGLSTGVTRVTGLTANPLGHTVGFYYNISGLTADGWRSAAPNMVGGQAGEQYVASCYVFVPTGQTYDAGTPCLEIQYFKADNTRISTSTKAINTSITNKWQRVVCVGTAPAETAKINARVWIRRNGKLYVTSLFLGIGNRDGGWQPHMDDMEYKLSSYATTTAMNAAIKTSADSITNTVSKTYATQSTVNGLTTRMASAESKLTATSLITTISSGLQGSNSITTTKFIMDKNGLHIKGGGFDISNNAGTKVLTADASGNLTMTGVINALSGKIGKFTLNDGLMYEGSSTYKGMSGQITEKYYLNISPNSTHLDVGNINRDYASSWTSPLLKVNTSNENSFELYPDGFLRTRQLKIGDGVVEGSLYFGPSQYSSNVSINAGGNISASGNVICKYIQPQYISCMAGNEITFDTTYNTLWFGYRACPSGGKIADWYFGNGTSGGQGIIHCRSIELGDTIYTSNWYRTRGACGWYSETYGGGIYMEDSTWIRTYNGKSLYSSATVCAGTTLESYGSLVVNGAALLKQNSWVGAHYSSVGWFGMYNAYNGTRKGYIGHTGGNDLNIVNEANGYINLHTLRDGYWGMIQYLKEANGGRNIWRPQTNGGAYIGTTSARWNTGFFTNSITASDLKEKQVLHTHDMKARDFIMAVKPIAYHRIGEGDTGKRIHYGFGAQTVDQTIKSLNLGNLSMVQASIINPDGTESPYNGEPIDDSRLSWGLNYNEFIPPMVSMLQEHEKDIYAVKQEIAYHKQDTNYKIVQNNELIKQQYKQEIWQLNQRILALESKISAMT